MTRFVWTEARETAAGLLAEDRLTDEQIAELIGVKRQTMALWKNRPEFKARVEAIVEKTRAAVEAEAIASKRNRIAALNDRWARMRRVVDERAADPDMADVPGGKTGLLVRTYRSIGSGPFAERVEEYAVDIGLLKEFREHEEQAAREIGDRKESAPSAAAALAAITVNLTYERPETDRHTLTLSPSGAEGGHSAGEAI